MTNYKDNNNHRTFALAIFSALVLIAGGVTPYAYQGAFAAPITICVNLIGANETPPVTSKLAGIAAISYDSVTREFIYKMDVNPDPSATAPYPTMTAAHIHTGAVGVAGPPAVTLDLPNTGGHTITLTTEQDTNLNAGNLYINVHTDVNPGGELRGQIDKNINTGCTPPGGGGGPGPGPGNNLPVANPQTLSTPTNVNLNIVLTANDGDGDPLTYSIASNPTQGILTGLNSATGQVTYDPNDGYTGPDSFTFKANDGKGDSSPATITINVGGGGPGPGPGPGPGGEIDSLPFILELEGETHFADQKVTIKIEGENQIGSFTGPDGETFKFNHLTATDDGDDDNGDEVSVTFGKGKGDDDITFDNANRFDGDILVIPAEAAAKNADEPGSDIRILTGFIHPEAFTSPDDPENEGAFFITRIVDKTVLENAYGVINKGGFADLFHFIQCDKEGEFGDDGPEELAEDDEGCNINDYDIELADRTIVVLSFSGEGEIEGGTDDAKASLGNFTAILSGNDKKTNKLMNMTLTGQYECDAELKPTSLITSGVTGTLEVQDDMQDITNIELKPNDSAKKIDVKGKVDGKPFKATIKLASKMNCENQEDGSSPESIDFTNKSTMIAKIGSILYQLKSNIDGSIGFEN